MPYARALLAWPVIAVALGFIIVTAALQPHPASAKCNPNRPNVGNSSYGSEGKWFNGWYALGNITRHQAIVKNYSPWVHPVSPPGGGASYVAAIVTLRWLNYSDYFDHNYAHMGWIEYPYDVRKTVVQFSTWVGTQKVYRHREYPPYAVGLNTNYEVRLNTATSYFEFWAAGQKLDQTGASFYPNRAETKGQMNTLSNQMPGGYGGTSHYEWFNNDIYLSGGGSWYPLGATAGFETDSQYFGLAVGDLSGYSLKSWDKACPY
jgi:hypothetical protein